jgi:hypothetical protein
MQQYMAPVAAGLGLLTGFLLILLLLLTQTMQCYKLLHSGVASAMEDAGLQKGSWLCQHGLSC